MMDVITRNKINAIWDGMWNNQMADAKTNLTQIIYLLYIKMLDDAQIKKEGNAKLFSQKVKNPVFKEGVYKTVKDEEGNIVEEVSYEDLRWHNFVHFETNKMFHIVKDFVFPFIREHNNQTDNAVSRFMGDAKLDIPSGKILERVVRGLDDPELKLEEKDVLGDVIEYLLAKLAVNGTNGQFRTPRHIIKMIIDIMKPKLGSKICDPAMGSAGFLVEAAKYMEREYEGELLNPETRRIFDNETFYGNEVEMDMLRIATMNLTAHSVSNPQIFYRNSLSDDFKADYFFDDLYTNPPFSGSIDLNDISKSITDIVSSKATELLFLGLFLRILRTGGRCASIFPVGVVNNTGKAYHDLRKKLVEEQKLQAIIYLPGGVFKPYSGVQTCILFFNKTDNGGTDKVWLYNMENDGFSLDDKRVEIKENDIPDIVQRYCSEDENNRTRFDKSFFVDKEEIVKNDYVLSWNKYRKIEQKKLNYRPSEEILDSVLKSDSDFLSTCLELSGTSKVDYYLSLLSLLNDEEKQEVISRINELKQKGE